MSKFRLKMYQFMQGRRGVDQLGKFILYVAVAIFFVSLFLTKFTLVYRILYYVGLILLIYEYFRMLSRDIYKRERENNKYLALKYRLTKGKTFKQARADRVNFTYFKCPGCGQKMRAPKGRGKVRVNCHKCGAKFEKKV